MLKARDIAKMISPLAGVEQKFILIVVNPTTTDWVNNLNNNDLCGEVMLNCIFNLMSADPNFISIDKKTGEIKDA
jgi:hypothetical protein